MSIFSHLSYSFFNSKGRALWHRLGRSAGFTLIELLVVISIMLIITTVMLLQQKSFNSSTILRTLTYGVAQSVRQAQSFGTSVKGEYSAGITVFTQVHGLYFAASAPTSYLLFADVGNDGVYDSGTDIVSNTFTLGSGYTVSKFCAHIASPATDVCSDLGTITKLAIVFRRPDPDACIWTDDASSATACAAAGAPVYSSAYIQVRSPGGSTRKVNISTTGQISVGDANL